MMISLHPFQSAAIEKVRLVWGQHRRALIHLPTGTGKTITGLQLAKAALDKGFRVLWLAHREELLTHPLNDVRALFPDFSQRAGIIKAHCDEYSAQIVFASVQTLGRGEGLPRLARYLKNGAPKLVVVDECHHAASPTWASILAALPDAYFLGLTATPERSDGKPLGDWMIAYSYPIGAAIADGYLCPPRFVVSRLPGLDTGKITIRGNDYDIEQLSAELLRLGVVEHTNLCMGREKWRKALVFTATIAQATDTAIALSNSGITSDIISDSTRPADRRGILAALRSGKIRAIANCAVLTEGYDDPSIDCIVLARPTKSKPLYLQCVGRGLRLYPGKSDCLVLDLAGASEEHDLVQAGALIREARKAPDGTIIQAVARGDGRGDNGMLEKRDRRTFSWVRLPGIAATAYALGCGREGTAILIDGTDGWLPLLIRKNGSVEPMVSAEHAMGAEQAQAIGEDFARQSRVALASAGWRKKAASDKQISLLGRFKLSGIGKSSGEAADALTAEMARRAMIKAGLTTRTDITTRTDKEIQL